MALHRNTGRHQEAEAIRRELTRLMTLADTNFALKCSLAPPQP